MDALEAIKTRRSTRKFKEDMPPRELLDKIIEAGPDTYVSLKYAIEASSGEDPVRKKRESGYLGWQ